MHTKAIHIAVSSAPQGARRRILADSRIAMKTTGSMNRKIVVYRAVLVRSVRGSPQDDHVKFVTARSLHQHRRASTSEIDILTQCFLYCTRIFDAVANKPVESRIDTKTRLIRDGARRLGKSRKSAGYLEKLLVWSHQAHEKLVESSWDTAYSALRSVSNGGG